jgi:hypothetical protein
VTGEWRNGDEWRNALDALEHRVERQIRQTLAPIAENVKDIRLLQQQQNGRVGRLEEDRIRRDAADAVRAELAHHAVETAAKQAAEVVARHERSRKWWLGVVTAAGVGVGIVSTLAGLIAQWLS